MFVEEKNEILAKFYVDSNVMLLCRTPGGDGTVITSTNKILHLSASLPVSTNNFAANVSSLDVRDALDLWTKAIHKSADYLTSSGTIQLSIGDVSCTLHGSLNIAAFPAWLGPKESYKITLNDKGEETTLLRISGRNLEDLRERAAMMFIEQNNRLLESLKASLNIEKEKEVAPRM